MLKNTDLFIARSFKARDYLLSIGAEEKKIKVIYKGINIKNFTLPKKKRGDNIVRILYVGQLVETKGLSDLLRAFEMLCKDFDNLELLLSGRSEGERLQRKIEEESAIEEKKTKVPMLLRIL